MSTPPGLDSILDELRSALGPQGVLTGADAEPFVIDARGIYRSKVAAVVRPGSTEQVGAVVRACAAGGVAIINQGGNTGLSGGTTVETGSALMLNLGRMNAIESVSAEQSTMTVQAGVTIEAMHDAAAEHGRLFAPDWGARGSATIGGGIATDAGGNNVLRYGNMRDQVLGLEVVLPDGRIWNGLRSLRKDSSGYDLKQLFVGSEGTLGVITRAVVKLHPATPHGQSALASLPQLEALTALYALAHQMAPDMVTAFEIVPEVGLAQVCRLYDIPRPIDEPAEFYALIKLTSGQPVGDAMAALLAEAAERSLITDAIVAATADQEKRLWTIRDELTPARSFPDTQSVGLKMDAALPLDQMFAYHDGVKAIVAELAPEALAYGFGHVGDGNLHMMVLPTAVADMEGFAAKRDALVERIDQLTFDLGGTLSAEHGIGRELRTRVAGQKPAIEWELMHAIKGLFDPLGIMNPGALLPDALL